MKNKITIQDIARIAGVSKSTVSRSLNDNPMIAENTRKKIHRIARDLNFTYNTSARSLTLNKIDSIGIITTEDIAVTDYINLLTGTVREYFEEQGIDVLLAHAQNRKTGESNIQRLVRTAKVSGLFIISPDVKNEDWDFLRSTGFPSVIAHFRPGNTLYSDFNCFFVDNRKGGYEAGKCLIRSSRTRLMTMTEGKGQIQFLDRTAGFIQALSEQGLELEEQHFIEGECSYAYAYQAIMDRKSLLRKIDGIFVQADVMAAGVINALQDLKIPVPGQIAVIGFDDVTYSSYLRPSLTTIRQPGLKLIRAASCCLFDQIESPEIIEPKQILFSPELLIRQSCL
jgi:DNA-binding LacI/PurR family transcriptional regulator